MEWGPAEGVLEGGVGAGVGEEVDGDGVIEEDGEVERGQAEGDVVTEIEGGGD